MSEEIYNILMELRQTTKKLEKENILTEHKDNIILQEIFRLAYSPTVQFYIKKIPDWQDDCEIIEDKNSYEHIFLKLGKLSSREVTGDSAKKILVNLLEHCDACNQEIIQCIISKDLRCGVGDSTINKIWKDLIPKVPQMLAQPMKDKTLSKIKYPAVAELKSDGSRCIAYCNSEGARLMSRNGKQYQGLVDLEESLQDSLFDGLVLDGELVFDVNKADRTTGNGIITKAVKGTISESEQKNVVFQVWDVIPQKDYVEKGVVKVPQHVRYKGLGELLNLANKENVQIIPSHTVNSLDEAKEVFRSYVEQGFEGIILKNIGGYWEDKRSQNLVKFKEELFADLEVVGMFEGSGKYQGMLGGLSLRSSDGVIKVNVGSGFNDEQRIEYFNEDLVSGKIVEIKYNGVTTDKRTGEKSLFLPIFQRFRDDKSEANNSEEMC